MFVCSRFVSMPRQLNIYRIQIQSIGAKVSTIGPLNAAQENCYPAEKRFIGKRSKNPLPNIWGNIKAFLFAIRKFQQQNIVAFRFYRFDARIHFAYFKGSIWKTLVPVEAIVGFNFCKDSKISENERILPNYCFCGAAARLWLTIQTPVKTNIMATAFFQVKWSKPMMMLMTVAMMGCT